MTKNKIARNVLSALMALCLLFTGVFAVLAAEVGDFTGDGKVSSADAVYLLRHTLFPEMYPLG